MNRTIALAGLAILMTGPAMAAGTCTTAPQAQWQSQATLTQQLKTKGLSVRQIKVEKGCYEVYATDTSGKHINIAFNAQTLQQLNNAEAGEN
jgi:hypothetical protein